MTRDPSRADGLQTLGAEVIRGDLRDASAVGEALRGTTQVVHAAHSVAGNGAAAPRYVDDAGTRRLIDLAKVSRIERFVYCSAIGASFDHPIDFFRIKAKIEAYLRASGVSHTILRPSPFMESWAQLIGGPISGGRRPTIFGSGKNPINFVSAVDVARYVVIALTDPELRNVTLEIGGPADLTFENVADAYEKVFQRSPHRRHVPLVLMRVMAAVASPLNPAVSRQIRAGILMDTTDQRFLHTHPSRFRLTTLSDVIERRT